MKEYSFNVALHGKHFFRTDWYDNVNHVHLLEASLASKFRASEHYSIMRSERDKTITNSDVAN